ncbi:hypothetical protein ACE6H2_021334 [Prunus campanulata]
MILSMLCTYGELCSWLVSRYAQVALHVLGKKLALSNLLWCKWNFTVCKCKKSITRMFLDWKFSPPSKCDLDGCNRNFNPIRSTAQMIDFQKIR